MDIAFISTPYDESITKHNYKKKRFRSHRDIVVAGDAFSDLKGKKLSLSDLNEYPLIGLKKGTETFDFYKHFFASNSLPYQPAIETINTDQIMIYTLENQGISFIHPQDAKKHIESGKLFKIKIKEEFPVRYTAFIRNKKDKKNAISFEKLLLNQSNTSL